jgi:hypothetical protein
MANSQIPTFLVSGISSAWLFGPFCWLHYLSFNQIYSTLACVKFSLMVVLFLLLGAIPAVSE